MVRLHYAANKAIPHPDFVFRLHSEMGTPITDTLYMAPMESILPESTSGKGYVELEIDNRGPSCWLRTSTGFGLPLKRIGQIVYDAVENLREASKLKRLIRYLSFVKSDE